MLLVPKLLDRGKMSNQVSPPFVEPTSFGSLSFKPSNQARRTALIYKYTNRGIQVQEHSGRNQHSSDDQPPVNPG